MENEDSNSFLPITFSFLHPHFPSITNFELNPYFALTLFSLAVYMCVYTFCVYVCILSLCVYMCVYTTDEKREQRGGRQGKGVRW